MNRNHNYLGVSSVVGLIVVLGTAGIDALMAILQHRNAETFSLNSVILW